MQFQRSTTLILFFVTVGCLYGVHGQACTDFGKDIEGAAVDKQGTHYAVNGELCLLQKPPLCYNW